MNIIDIKNLISSTLKVIKENIKETFKMPFAKRYLMITLILTIFFIFITFPYGIIIKNYIQTAKFSNINTIQIGNLNFSLIGTSNLNYIKINYKSNKSLTIKSLELNPEIFGYLLSNKICTTIYSDNFHYQNKETEYFGKINSNVDLKLLEKEKQKSISGSIFITFSDLVIKNFNFKNIITNPTYREFISGAINKNDIKFKAIEFNVDISDSDKVIKVNKITFTGKDLSGKISGNINLAPQFKNSRINLKIDINEKSELIKNLASLLHPKNGKIQINLNGTIDHPNIDFQDNSKK